MPLVATRGAASAQGFGEFAQTTAPVYIEDVFSTYLYTGNGSTQTITNGIDLSTKGGLVWIKNRATGPAGSPPFTASDNSFYDTARGAQKFLSSNSTGAQADFGVSGGLQSFTSTGFSVKDTSAGEYAANGSFFQNSSPALTYVSWTFRKQPKFFDVVTYTGNGTGDRAINHSLGAVPGCVIVKKTNAAQNWAVWHRTFTTGDHIYLNTTGAVVNNTVVFGTNANTSTTFNVGSFLNANGDTYVAYLFAHDAGGFGLTGTDNVISCGSFTSDGSGSVPDLNLGYEPQWFLYKSSTNAENWYLIDNMRGFPVSGNAVRLYPNLSAAEQTSSYEPIPTATGLTWLPGSYGANRTYIYIAIRRGPMKTPTSGTSVYSNAFATGTGTSNTLVNANFPPDLYISKVTNATGFFWLWYDRLRGSQYLKSNSSDAEVSSSDVSLTSNQNGAVLSSWAFVNGSSYTNSRQSLRRAPGFFDVVCYTGTGTFNRAINHNLTVAPELIIVKSRSTLNNWPVRTTYISSSECQYFNLDFNNQPSVFPTTAPTSSFFYVDNYGSVNSNAVTYVAYLFASCPGVSKVGSYTGTGSTQTINCGFAAGARFVLIKRTNGTGDWYFYDSARGITSGNDPYLWLNTDDQQVTSTNFINTNSAGFELNGSSLINASGGTFIFLAIA